MKSTLSLVFLFVVAALLPLQAEDSKGPEVRGVVTTVVGTTVTVATDKQGEMAYATNGQTKILKLDGTAGKLTDLAPGTLVVIATDGNTASEIRIMPTDEKITPKKAP